MTGTCYLTIGISVKYDGAVKVIEVTKETYMSYQIGDNVFMDVLTGKRI